MKKLLMISFLLAAAGAFPVYAQIDLSQIGADRPAAGQNSVVFKNRAEEVPEPPSVMQREEIAEPQPAPAPKPVPVKLFGNGVKIVALVNGEIISTDDLQNRINAFVMNTQIPLNEQTKDLIIHRTLQAAIDEKLKIQDAEKNGITITEKDIDNSVRFFEKTNKIPHGQLKNILKEAGVSEDVFREQMKSDLAWVRLVRKKTLAEGELTQKELEEAQAAAVKDLNTPKYMVSEILIKKNNAKNLNDLVANLRQDPRFELYAMQFSEAPSAAGGGKLGWINKERLIAPLSSALGKMKPGDVSSPINVNGDYYILKLEKVFDPKKDTAEEPTIENIKKFLENRRMEELASRHLQNLRQAAVIELRN